jgi:hypothetical protein
MEDGSSSSSPSLLVERASEMASRAARGQPLTDSEIQLVVKSVRSIVIVRGTNASSEEAGGAEGDGEDEALKSTDNDRRLVELLRSAAHLSHKDWAVVEVNSDQLLSILFPAAGGDSSSDGGDSSSEGDNSFDATAPLVLDRILTEGNWKAAMDHASSSAASASDDEPGSPHRPISRRKRPWAVLVSGVNGIRKTTSMYQPWFSQVLEEALVPPPSLSLSNGRAAAAMPTNGNGDDDTIPRELLPTGHNSFFRQLDHMIATLCNREFEMLYRLTESECQRTLAGTNSRLKDDDEATTIPPEAIEKYSNLKAAIFARYRTLSELLGALLLKQARKRNMNCLMETSGKDVAMFQYVDHFLPAYNKLALRFEINALDLAKKSVDDRMTSEIRAGIKARTVRDIIYANQGGPYGSQVLPSIQRDSDNVWNTQVLTHRGVGDDWYKATIRITAYPDRPWTAQAVRPDGTMGTLNEFASCQRN